MAIKNVDEIIGVPVVLPNSRPWTAYTPTLTGTGSKVFVCTAYYRDHLDSREVIFMCSGNATAAGAGAIDLAMSLPPNSTITASKLPSGSFGSGGNVLGICQTFGVESASVFDEATTVAPLTATTVGFIRPGVAAFYNTANINSANIVTFSGRFTMAIDELAGGYTAYGAGLATSAKAGLVSAQTPQTALTVTCALAGFTTTRAMGIAYSDSNGVWRLKGNVQAAFTAASMTTFTIAITGVTFKTGFAQNVSANFNNIASAIPRTYANGGTSGIVFDFASNTPNGIQFTFDLELDSKPSWA